MSLSSSSSATVAVEKATSDLLISPDWTMNIDICDSINSNHWQAKDVMKAVKRRLQHRNPKVQLLSLTLIETMVKNCGDYVHFQIAERNILGEMIKIVKKKADMNVRDKILVLLDSWQEAFGGPGGKHPQYYWAYDELRRSGIEFPKRSLDTAPIFTPPVSNPNPRITQAGYGMPSNSSRRLDETMATEIEGLSLSSLDSMRNVMELLNDMLQAVNPGDTLAVKDEVIVDLVNRCRANQKKLMQMLTTTGDEELLGRGLELNDSMQNLLAKHDAIASGLPLPTQATSLSFQHSESSAAMQKASEIRDPGLRDSSPPPTVNHTLATASVTTKSQIDEEEEEEDEFAQLARRHSKSQPVPSQSFSTGTVESLALVSTGNTTASPVPAPASPCTALALPDPPAPVKTSKEQDMIDLLSITLSTSTNSPHTPLTPSTLNQNTHQVPVSPSAQGYHQTSNQEQIPYNSYVVPWAQPGPHVQLRSQTQPQLHSQQQAQHQPQPQTQHQPQPQARHQPQPQAQPQPQPLFSPQYVQYSPGYPPPPWAAANNMAYTRGSEPTFSTSTLPARPLQHVNSFPARGNYESSMRADSWATLGPRNSTPSTAQKPFIPSYRLFEDLNVFGNGDARLKVTSSSASSRLAGASGQSMENSPKRCLYPRQILQFRH